MLKIDNAVVQKKYKVVREDGWDRLPDFPARAQNFPSRFSYLKSKLSFT